MQVKLWQLLAAFLCITVSIGYWAIQRRNYLVEQKGIQQIEEAGGYVADYMCFDHGVFSEYKVDGAGQYRGLRYARVTGIIVERFQDSYGSGELHKDAIMVATQRLAKGIQRLPETKFIRISDPRFGDRHLDQLSSIPSLEFLDLSGCSVGDAGLESLSRFPMLRALSLRGTKVYSDFQSFGKLERLKKLDLSGTRVNHFGLDSLTEATELHELLLSSTDTTDGDLATLAKLHRLRLLDLSDTPVTGKGLSFLTGLSNLQSLTLSGDLDFSFLCNLRVTKLEIVDLFEKNPTLFGIKSIVGLSDLELEGTLYQIRS